jgi:preprotein translocase subunit SecF
MKRVIKFIEIRWIMITISVILIVGLNVASMFMHKKLNLGIDFAGGMTMQIQIAPVAMDVQYQGEGKADLLISGNLMTLKVNRGEKTEEFAFNFDNYDSIKAVALDMQKISGIVVQLGKFPDAKPQRIISLDYPITMVKGMTSYVNMKLPSTKDIYTNIHEIRNMLVNLGNPSVQDVGAPENQEFAVKIQQGEFANQEAGIKKDATSSNESTIIDAAKTKLVSLLSSKFDSQTIRIKSTDFVGPSFSKELLQAAIIAVIIAVLLILIYITFRFKLDFGFGAIVALIHDVLMMISFINFFNLEWNATTIAAILTIIGYSNNDTIVIFARIRENLKIMHEGKMELIIDTSITQSLSRSIYTHVTVLCAIIPIYILTSGTIKDFAFNMIVGVISGTYSSIYMAAPVVLMWRNSVAKRAKQKTDGSSGKGTSAKIAKTDIAAQEASALASSAIGSENANPNNEGLNSAPAAEAARFQRKKKKKKKR